MKVVMYSDDDEVAADALFQSYALLGADPEMANVLAYDLGVRNKLLFELPCSGTQSPQVPLFVRLCLQSHLVWMIWWHLQGSREDVVSAYEANGFSRLSKENCDFAMLCGLATVPSETLLHSLK
eukprot:3446752-Amphidinium_carterae.2